VRREELKQAYSVLSVDEKRVWSIDDP